MVIMSLMSLKDKVIAYFFTKKIYLLAFSLYCLLTYIMAYLPVSIDLGKTYLGWGEVVVWSNYFWWFDYAITNSLNPLHHSFVFYPLGLDMVDSIFPLLLFAPITHFFGSVVSCNLYVMSTFLLAGYGMFLLASYLLKDPYAAFFAGVVFAFSPFHFGASISPLHSYSILWIPFFVLFFLKMYEKPTGSNILLASLFFAMNALTSWTIAIMLAIFCLLYMLYQINYTLSKDFSPKLGIFFLMSLAFTAPGLHLILKNMLTNKHMFMPIREFIFHSADILAFIVPSPMHPIFGEISSTIYSNFSGNYGEKFVFIGYIVILLSLVGMRIWLKDDFGRFILICTGVFFILSLGPFLHIFGIYQFTSNNLTIMLPGILTYYIPFLDMIRVPSRYAIMFMFFMSLISAYGLKYILEKMPKNCWNRFILSAIFTTILVFEFMAVLPVTDARATPDFYYSICNDDKGAIIELPFIRSPLDEAGWGYTMTLYYEYQKTHQKPIMGGYFNRINPVYAQHMQKDPVLTHLYFGKDDIIQFPVLDRLEHLGLNYDISYIVLHKNFLRENDLNALITYLGKYYTVDASVQSDQLVIYKIDEISEECVKSNVSKVWLEDGWHELEMWGTIPTRWVSQNATIVIDSTEDYVARLNFSALSFHHPRSLEIYSEDRMIYRMTVSKNISSVTIPIHLNKGENIIRFYVPDGSERPCDIPKLNNEDSRCLSVAIQRVMIM